MDPDPDPLVRGTDPRIWIQILIHTKMSRIPNTAFHTSEMTTNNFLKPLTTPHASFALLLLSFLWFFPFPLPSVFPPLPLPPHSTRSEILLANPLILLLSTL